MHKFDVRYSLKNYYEYYKHALLTSKMFTDILISVVFIGLAVYIWVDQSDATKGNALAIISLVMGISFPLMNFVTLALVKRQLNARASTIADTHIIVTFDEEDVLYENLTPEVISEEKPQEKAEEKDVQVVDNTATPEEESLEGSINKDVTPQHEEEKVENKEERSFRLQYGNFMKVKETKGLFLFYLDKKTVIILPKETYLNEDGSLESFKQFILSKVNPKRCKFMKK